MPTYIIGEVPNNIYYLRSAKFSTEHMEEDDEDTKVIPEWVELEYRVGENRFRELHIITSCDLLANENISWRRVNCSFYRTLK